MVRIIFVLLQVESSAFLRSNGLEQAVSAKAVKCVELMLEGWSDEYGPNGAIGYENRKRPLTWAVIKKSPEIAEYLLRSGAEVNSRGSSWRETALHEACENGKNFVLVLVILI